MNFRTNLSNRKTRLKCYFNQNPRQISYISLVLGAIIGGGMVFMYFSESWLSTFVSLFASLSFTALIAVISFYWVHLRGPAIACSPINTVSISSNPTISSPNPIIKLTFSLTNSGGSNGVVENIFLKLVEIPSGSYQQASPGQIFWMYDINSKLPSIIKKDEAVPMPSIQFTCKNTDFHLHDASYRLELYLLLSNNPKIERKVYEILSIPIDEKTLKKERITRYCIDPLNDRWEVVVTPP